MHKHVAPRRLPNPIIVVTGLALIFAVIIAGLAVITTKRPDTAPPKISAPVSEPVTADPSATLTLDRVSVATSPAPAPEPTAPVQDWTPEAPQIPVMPVGAPEVGAEYCEEDMPCWDCATMGNLVCGTIDDSAAAWAAWDANDGASLLNMDPARPFRVDYMASTPEAPQNMTANDVAVMLDGTWYVFHASYTDAPEETCDLA
jgi:hypothetical protein